MSEPSTGQIERVLVDLKAHAKLMSEALYALHVQGTHLQAVLCALVDTHPEPASLLASFSAQIEHSRAAISPQGSEEFDVQSDAWKQRIAARALAVEHGFAGQGRQDVGAAQH